MGYRWSEIANQNFQPGSDYLKSIANTARKAYCTVIAPVDVWLADTFPFPAESEALSRELARSLCELPEDPVPLPPADRLPSNIGQCQCQPYRVAYTVFTNGVPFESGSIDRLGPINVSRREIPGSGGSTLVLVGITHRGNTTQACSPTAIVDDLLQASKSSNPTISIDSIVPVPNYGFVDCARSTFPTDKPRSPDNEPPRPTIDIPRPTLPPITIPIFPVPIPVLPGVEFSPKLVLDVGGINIEFSIGEVNFKFNPQLNAPITIFPPGYGQPTLPPSVQPLPSPGGEDCCEEILEILDVISTRTQRIDLNVQDVEQTADNIEAVQSNNVIPLLEDIMKCACPLETVQVATFNNLQGYTYNNADTKLAFAQVNVLTNDIKKTWTVDGGKEVALVGWFAFGRDGRLGVRRPLQFRNNLCLPEERGMNEFTFGLYNGITANGTVHAEENEES